MNSDEKIRKLKKLLLLDEITQEDYDKKIKELKNNEEIEANKKRTIKRIVYIIIGIVVAIIIIQTIITLLLFTK